jgi:hypothetical protein
MTIGRERSLNFADPVFRSVSAFTTLAQLKNSELIMQKTTLACVQWFYSPKDVMEAHPTEEIKRWCAQYNSQKTDGC